MPSGARLYCREWFDARIGSLVWGVTGDAWEAVRFSNRFRAVRWYFKRTVWAGDRMSRRSKIDLLRMKDSSYLNVAELPTDQCAPLFGLGVAS